jgi:lipopolysaccharide export system permease protein
MTTFDYYMIRRLLAGYIGVLIGVIVFFIVLHYVEFIDDFMDRGATMLSVFTVYYPNSVPEYIQLGSPLALFLAAIYVTGRSAQHLEIASLQTSGVSLFRILVPFSVVGVLVSVVMFWFNGWIVPETNRVKIAFEQDFTKATSGQVEFSNIHRQNRPGSVLSIAYFDRTTNTATTVSLHSFDANLRLIERLDAPRMTWVDSTGLWTLIEPVVRKFDASGRESEMSYSLKDTLLSIIPRDLARTEADVDAMTIPEARAYLDELSRSGADHTGLAWVSYYNKYAYPFSNLILVLLAVPIASVRRRGGQAFQLGMGLFIAFVYLATMKLIQPFGYANFLSPMIATWLPHAIFAGFAVIVFFRTRT